MNIGKYFSIYLRDDICRVPGVVVHDAGGVDVVGVGAVHQRVQHHPVVVVGELVRVAVLLLVLHLSQDAEDDTTTSTSTSTTTGTSP